MNLMDYVAILPEIFLLVTVVGILLVECLAKQSKMCCIHRLTLLGLFVSFVGVFISNAVFPLDMGITYYWMNELALSPITNVLRGSMLVIVFIGLIYSGAVIERENINKSEFYILILLSTVGMLVLPTANSLLMIYLGLELMSLPLYALVAFNRKSDQGTEAAMKYFIMGSIASALLLFGMALLYGATGSLQLDVIQIAMVQIAERDLANNILLIFSTVFLVVGIAFKLGVAPFHSWVPDVYEAAPAPVALFVGAAPKIAAISMGYSLLLFAGFNISKSWEQMLAILIVLSFIIGNFVALKQLNFRRMLGYSAISHAGFMLLGLFYVDSVITLASSAYFYAISYALTTVAMFGFIMLINYKGALIHKISDFKGFGKKHGWYALLISVVMLSMGGIPPFVGFIAKFVVLNNAYNAGYGFLVIFGLLASVVGLFYYLRIIKVMFFDEPDADAIWEINSCKCQRLLLNVNVIVLILLGIIPSLLLNLVR